MSIPASSVADLNAQFASVLQITNTNTRFIELWKTSERYLKCTPPNIDQALACAHAIERTNVDFSLAIQSIVVALLKPGSHADPARAYACAMELPREDDQGFALLKIGQFFLEATPPQPDKAMEYFEQIKDPSVKPSALSKIDDFHRRNNNPEAEHKESLFVAESGFTGDLTDTEWDGYVDKALDLSSLRH